MTCKVNSYRKPAACFSSSETLSLPHRIFNAFLKLCDLVYFPLTTKVLNATSNSSPISLHRVYNLARTGSVGPAEHLALSLLVRFLKSLVMHSRSSCSFDNPEVDWYISLDLESIIAVKLMNWRMLPAKLTAASASMSGHGKLYNVSMAAKRPFSTIEWRRRHCRRCSCDVFRRSLVGDSPDQGIPEGPQGAR